MIKRKETNIEKRNKKSILFAKFIKKSVDDKWVIYRKLSLTYLSKILFFRKKDQLNISELCVYIHKNKIGNPRVWMAAIFYYYWKNVTRNRYSRRKTIALFFGVNLDYMTQKANQVAIIVKENKTLEKIIDEPDF